MNITIWGKVSLVLALFGALGMGFGIASVVRSPATGENVERPVIEAPPVKPAQAVVVPEIKDTHPAVVESSPKPPVDTHSTAAAVPDTGIIERMLASEKRLGDALFVLRRDYKQLHDTVVMLLNRAGTATPARAAQTRPERVEKSVVVRRALEGYLGR